MEKSTAFFGSFNKVNYSNTLFSNFWIKCTDYTRDATYAEELRDAGDDERNHPSKSSSIL